MGWFLFQAALKEYLRPKRLIPWLIIALFGGALAMIWMRAAPDSSKVEVYSQVSSIIVFHLLALASAIFTTAIITQEVEQKTIVYLLTRPVPRPMLLLARYLASVVVVAIIAAFAALAASFGVYGADALSNSLLPKDILALTAGAFAYGALFLLISLIINRAMIVCLLFAFGWETSIPNFRGEIYYLSIYSYLQAIAQHPSTDNKRNVLDLLAGQLGTNTLTPGQAWPVLIVMTVAFVGISMWWFRHFEYVPREDAE